MGGLKNKFLRSARLARGFQVLESTPSAFSVWTAPYCGGVAIVPSSNLQEPEVEEAVESAEDEGAEAAKLGAFTVWTAEFVGISLDESTASPEEDEDAEEALIAAGDDDSEATSDSPEESPVAPIVVALPAEDSEVQDEPVSGDSVVDEPVAEESEESEEEANKDEPAPVENTESDDSPSPLRVVPKETE